MKRYFSSFCFFIFSVSFLFPYTFNIDAYALSEISDVRFGKNRVVVDLSAKVNDYKVFTLENPTRLVVDIKDASLTQQVADSIQNNISKYANVSLIDNFRHSLNADYLLRLVLGFNANIDVQKSFLLQPSQDNNKYRIVVDYEKQGNISLKTEDGSYQEERVPLENLDDIINENILSVDSALSAGIYSNLVNVQPVKRYNKDNSVALSEANPIRKPNISKDNATKKKSHIPIIVIDAGHGGKDPGAIGFSGIKEKEVTLTYATDLYHALKKTKKYKVYLTRNDDSYITLEGRVQKAQKLKADLFISIHADSTKNRKAKGFSVYTLSERASDREAQRIARKENKANVISGVNLNNEYTEVANFLVGLTQRYHMNYSAVFANILLKQMSKQIDLVNRAHRFAGFRVLTGTDMASVLVELGFLSNKQNERALRQRGYRQKIIHAFVIAIDQFFDNPR